MRLVGHLRPFEGDYLNADLVLDEATLHVSGRVVRTDPQRAELAIEFRALTDETRATIEAAVAALLERIRTSGAPTALVMQVPAETYGALARDLAHLDRRELACVTDADVFAALAQPCEGIIVAGALGDAAIAALFERLAAEHPKLRRVVLFE